MRQRKDDVEVRHGQQFGRARCQPFCARVPLALGAVPVAAGVERDGLMAAADALIAMTAQCRGAAADDGIECGHARCAFCCSKKLLPVRRTMSATSRVGRLIA